MIKRTPFNEPRQASKREIWNKALEVSENGKLPGFPDAIKNLTSVLGPDAIDSITIKDGDNVIEWQREN